MKPYPNVLKSFENKLQKIYLVPATLRPETMLVKKKIIFYFYFLFFIFNFNFISFKLNLGMVKQIVGYYQKVIMVHLRLIKKKFSFVLRDLHLIFHIKIILQKLEKQNV